MKEKKSNLSKSKNTSYKKWLLVTGIPLVSSFLMVLFALTWQDAYTLIAYCNAFYFSGFMFFFFGWMIFMTNLSVLAPLVYGLKSFFLMFAGKRPQLDYFEYTEDKVNNPIPKIYIRIGFISAFLNTVIAIVLHVML